MKNSLLTAISLCLGLLTSCASGRVSGKTQADKIEVNDAFQKVYKVTQEALAQKNDGSLKLKNVELTFATTSTIELGGGAKLWVVSGKHTRSNASAKQAKFTFAQDTLISQSFVKDKNIETFKNYLISVIDASQAIEKNEKFGLSEIEVEVAFTLTNKTEGEIEIELSPVTPSFSASREKENVHTITLTFAKTKTFSGYTGK